MYFYYLITIRLQLFEWKHFRLLPSPSIADNITDKKQFI